MKLIWATSCVEDEVRVGIHSEKQDETRDDIEAAVTKCLHDYRKKLTKKVEGFTAKRKQSLSGDGHAQGVLDKQFEQLRVTKGKEPENDENKVLAKFIVEEY